MTNWSRTRGDGNTRYLNKKRTLPYPLVRYRSRNWSLIMGLYPENMAFNNEVVS